MADTNMRILCLGYCFPPVASPEAFVTSKTMAAIPGAEVDVVTASANLYAQSPDHSLDAYVESRFGRIERIDGGLFRMLGKISRLPIRPDRYLLLARATAARAEAMQPDGYDCLVTRSQYHSVHAAGRRLKQRHPDLPWVACFSDPWSGGTYERQVPLMLSWSRNLERKVLREADALVFPTTDMRDYFAALNTEDPITHKSHVVPHGYDPALYDHPLDIQESQNIRLGMFGTFYGPRTPRRLLEAIERAAGDASLPDFTVEIFGLGGAAFNRELANYPAAGKHVTHGGVLPHTDALVRMKSFDLLVISDAPMSTRSMFLTSKIVDYLGSGRPLFAITPEGPTNDLIERIGGWSVSPDDSADVANVLSDAIRGVNAAIPHRSDAARDEYSIERIGRRFRDILDKVIASKVDTT
ncbi:MAG: glycosyltransferase [Rhodospirillaceae bacterium]|nr:glycosyltransferase [Rhodospirillaceae bacterium]MBT6535456.1 glycosyltransferase [Rhodospirillaceae bacterium]MBT7361810.1 glycosyltransferase [Rhodospirillaceae bacterium]